MTPTARAALRSLDVIEACVSTLHDLAAQAQLPTLAVLPTATPPDPRAVPTARP